MAKISTALPTSSWRRIRRVSFVMTATALTLSIVVSTVIMDRFGSGISLAGLSLAALMPLVLGAPMAFILLLRHEQLCVVNRQLEQLASTDWLTGCRTRGAFTHQVARRLADTGGALLVIDADNFKTVNDRFGHDLGDAALCLIARTLQTATASTEAIVGRLGGEEFGIFLVGADAAAADRIAQRVRAAVSAIPFSPGGTDWPLSVSIGGALCQSATPFSILYRCADQRLYQAKNSGRDCVAMMQAA